MKEGEETETPLSSRLEIQNGPCVRSGRLRVYRQHVRMCSTCRRFESTHGRGFRMPNRATHPHTTHTETNTHCTPTPAPTPTHDDTARHGTPHHNTQHTTHDTRHTTHDTRHTTHTVHTRQKPKHTTPHTTPTHHRQPTMILQVSIPIRKEKGVKHEKEKIWNVRNFMPTYCFGI